METKEAIKAFIEWAEENTPDAWWIYENADEAVDKFIEQHETPSVEKSEGEKSDIMECESCGWKGDEKDCPDFYYDSEGNKWNDPVCPKCDSTDIDYIKPPSPSQPEQEMKVEVDCPECNGEGFKIIADHGCDGTEENCAVTCPVPVQAPCACCGGSGVVQIPSTVPSETKQREKEEEQDFLDWPYEGICGKCSSPVLKLNRDYLCEGCISMGVTMLPNFSQEGIQSVMKFVRLRAKSATYPVSHQGTILHGKEGEVCQISDSNNLTKNERELIVEAVEHIKDVMPNDVNFDKFFSERNGGKTAEILSNEGVLISPIYAKLLAIEYAALAVKWPECPMKIGINDYQHGYQQAWKDCINECKKAHSGQSQ